VQVKQNWRYDGVQGAETMATQISRIGGTVAVDIPEELLRQANLAVGDSVEWVLTPTGNLALRAPLDVDVSDVEEGYEKWARQEIEAGLADIEAGKTVSGEKVREWVQSWGTEHELPPPL
jgi:antitoxin component of MazEF toxin-antitoxin module